MDKLRHHTRKIIIAIVGVFVVVLGVVMIPYPGPGWLVVFAGLAILATEFEFAQRVLDKLQGIYEGWRRWLEGQNILISFAILLLTLIIVVVSIWLVNGFGVLNAILRIDQQWLISPLFR